MQKPFVKELAEKERLLHKSRDLPLCPRCAFCPGVQVAGFPKFATFNGVTLTHSLNSPLGTGEDGLGCHFVPPPPSGNFLLDIWGVFLMQIVPLEATHLFDLNSAILGWLLAAVLPEKQFPRHSIVLYHVNQTKSKIYLKVPLFIAPCFSLASLYCIMRCWERKKNK